MRKFGLGGLAVVVVLAIGVISAPAASAAVTSKGCAASGFVPLSSGSPACTTAPLTITCSDTATTCTIVGKMLAKRTSGGGITRAKITLTDTTHGDTVNHTCRSVTTACQVPMGPYFFGGYTPANIVAKCEWTAPWTLLASARVDCAEYAEVVEG